MKMIDLENSGIYCTEYRWNLAQTSREGTIMIRHLMEGVFKHDKILNCTFSGQPPKNKPKTNEIIRPLHTKATSCIINLVLKRAEDNNWTKKNKTWICFLYMGNSTASSESALRGNKTHPPREF
ncbi:uncharacterized protein LOC123273017 [Cotesia glomerata]|nr:uncharacterized protein LOC123273017 [Cotesia glomerata]XP_044596033.1 uncharacterized protein LOC123273017 [Cotesia glomerata]